MRLVETQAHGTDIMSVGAESINIKFPTGRRSLKENPQNDKGRAKRAETFCAFRWEHAQLKTMEND